MDYQDGTSESFAEEAAKTFVVNVAVDGALVFEGLCPRCKAAIIYTKPRVVVRADPEASPATTASSTTNTSAVAVQAPSKEAVADGPHSGSVIILCTSNLTYEGQPAGRFGCGAFWSFLLIL